MDFLSVTRKHICYICVVSIFFVAPGCSYPSKHMRQGGCLLGSHKSYFYDWTRDTARITLGTHPVVIIFMFPFALIMLPLSIVIDTFELPADIWMESQFQNECSKWMENPRNACEEYRQATTEKNTIGNTSADNPTDRIPVCLLEKRSRSSDTPSGIPIPPQPLPASK